MTKIAIHNVETDEMIERDMTAEEAAQWEIDKADIEAGLAEKAAKAAARSAVYEKLGLTESDIEAILP